MNPTFIFGAKIQIIRKTRLFDNLASIWWVMKVQMEHSDKATFRKGETDESQETQNIENEI